MQEGDQVLTVTHHFCFVLVHLVVEQRLFHLQDNVSLGKDFLNIVNNLAAGFNIGAVSKESAVARALFNKNRGAVGNHLFDGVRSRGHAAFAVHDFLRHTDSHTLKFHYKTP